MFTSFQDYAENLKPSLDAAFTSHLTRLLEDTELSGGAGLLTGGKKIRGALLCLVATTLGATLEDALPRAVAVELIQLASLIHDDFVDQHRSRRGAPAIWTLEGARRAVLLGDVVFASAIQLMSELGRGDCLIVSRAIAELSRGAYQEPLNPAALAAKIEAGRVTGTLYEKIVYLKTGILFGAACELGGAAAGADDEVRQAWRRYGLKIGEAYQIADDLHEVEQSLLTHTITAAELTALAPALLFFVRESRPSYIVEALRRESLELEGESLVHFRATAESMQLEKESRLAGAVAALDGNVPADDPGRLVRSTPRDLIRMFDEAKPPRGPVPEVSLP